MGYVRIEYMIFEGDSKNLENLRKKIIKILAKEEDLSIDLIGNVHIGANGRNSLILHPHGWNGGWSSEHKDDILGAFNEVNYKEQQRYLKSKDPNDWEKSLNLKTFSHGDCGYKIELDNIFETLREGINPEVGFIINGRYSQTVKAADDELAKQQAERGEEDWKRKQYRIAAKLVELEDSKAKK